MIIGRDFQVYLYNPYPMNYDIISLDLQSMDLNDLRE